MLIVNEKQKIKTYCKLNVTYEILLIIQTTPMCFYIYMNGVARHTHARNRAVRNEVRAISNSAQPISPFGKGQSRRHPSPGDSRYLDTSLEAYSWELSNNILTNYKRRKLLFILLNGEARHKNTLWNIQNYLIKTVKSYKPQFSTQGHHTRRHHARRHHSGT